MRRRRVVAPAGAATIAVTILTSSSLAAAPLPRLVEGDVTLEYRRDASAASCPDEAALRERAADAFDFRDPFVPAGSSASSHLRVEIARVDGGFRGTVLIVDDAGVALASSEERHADCDALVWVIGHRVALAVLRRSPPAPTASTPAASAPSPPPSRPSLAAVLPKEDARRTEEPARRTEEPARRTEEPATRIDEAAPHTPAPSAIAASDVTLTAGAGSLLTVGFADEVGPGIWLGVSVQRGWLSLGVEGRGVFPAPAITYEPGRTSLITTLSGAIVPCARFKLLSGCAVVEGGSLLFTIPGIASAQTSFLFGVGPRAAVDLPIALGLSARLFAEATLHPVQPVFYVRRTTAPDSPLIQWVAPVASVIFGAGFTWSR